MGVDITLERDGQTVQVLRHQEGSTYAVGGTTDASIAITYNYGDQYRRAYTELGLPYDGMCKMFEDRLARDCVEEFRAVVSHLGTERDTDDYWESSPGNAGYALFVVLSWCALYPGATLRTWC